MPRSPSARPRINRFLIQRNGCQFTISRFRICTWLIPLPPAGWSFAGLGIIFAEEEISQGKLTGEDPYSLIDRGVETVEPGCEGLVMLPHLQGAMAPESNPNARGVFYGFTLRHGKSHFARLIMESIACIVRRNLDVIEDMGIQPSEIRVLGGGAKSHTWNQIKADMIGKPLLTTQNSDAACLGAAILAGKATGVYSDVEKACKEAVHIKRTFQPAKENFAIYDRVYHRYIDLYDNLRVMFG